MKKKIILGAGAVLVLAIASIGSVMFFKGKGVKEEFSSVRAYREEVSEDYFLDYEEPVALKDTFGNVDYAELRRQVLSAYEIVNAARMEKGLVPLKWSDRLDECAMTRAEELTYLFSNEHVRPNGSYWFTAAPNLLLGENIYKGHKTAEQAMESWLNNPADRDNFLCDEFNYIAISLCEDTDGNGYWAAEFSREAK